MKFWAFLGIFLASAFSLFSAKVLEAETITKNLFLGSTGAEVVTLQQVLVADGFLVMPYGVSYGYFGPLTKAATAMWQSANGVSPTLGYFGPISRSVLESKVLQGSQELPATPTLPVEPNTPSSGSTIIQGSQPEPDTYFAPGMLTNRVMLFRTFPYEVRAGDTITLDGSGFSKTSNRIYLGGQYITSTSSNGTVMKVIVPTGISSGEYELSVENIWGSSANPDLKIKIRVTDNPQPPPQITSASISGDTVTVVGTGFTSSNNLFTTLGDSSSSISSSGGTLTFRLSDLSRYEQIKGFTQGQYQVALWIYVLNEHGMNQDPYQLNINI